MMLENGGSGTLYETCRHLNCLLKLVILLLLGKYILSLSTKAQLKSPSDDKKPIPIIVARVLFKLILFPYCFGYKKAEYYLVCIPY
ncbi:hypothetical protein EUTSA_v10021855mg [Eutrema salsugineum]|uniref:Uncharacterized protein n=1 Tax=Eutrema salsugineum TaxID=72664 RepID=V4M1S6_EUTSA|nr:hypothetical protein EUTSA_v10021855mg [Eutrema salsugineum]